MASSKLYVLVTGKLYQKLKDMKKVTGYMAIETTDTYGIGGPIEPEVDSCILKRFNGTDGWELFNSLTEAREAASKL
jgi:hypothetical protein